MRHLLSLPAIALATALSGCGGSSSSSSTTTTGPLTYSIGGSIAGLSGTVVLLNNGSDKLSLSSNGSFTFFVTLQPNAPYDVTVATQPINQVCSVGNATGRATASVTNVTVVCSSNTTAADLWTWVAGADYANAAGVYGTEGTPSASNTPGARRQPVAWTDANGNFWLFGGSSAGNLSMLNDLWEYRPSAGQWVWQGGSDVVGAATSYGSQGAAAASNNPGAREGAAAWTDSAGNLWLFGGDNFAGQNRQQLNDLWSYNPTTGLWTWVGGSNTANNAGSYGTLGIAAASNLPPARTDAISWIDSAGVFWLFGGARLPSNGSPFTVFNDLWSYNASTGLWTWMGGSSTPNAAGVYGTQGIAAASNVPASRMNGSVWLDANGNVWLFGGSGVDSSGLSQEFNDLWEYSPASGMWTWVGGSNVANAEGVYGTQGASSAGSVPGARVAAVAWLDHAGNLWLFGGYGYAGGAFGNLNDVWEYNIVGGLWTWIGGSSSTAASGSYSPQGVPSISNTPGAREQAVGWVDSSGNFWLFGGFGFDSSGVEDDLNDLWSFTPSP